MAAQRSVEMGRGHVTLATDKSAFVKGLEEARAEMKAWGDSLGKLGASIVAMGAAIVAPFAAGLAIFAETGAALNSTARRAGVGVAELGGLAAATGGDLDALNTGMAHLAAFMEQASQGGQAASHALAQIGLSFAQLNSMTQDERLRAIAEGLNGVADAGQRIALQRGIFGRSAMDLNLSGGAAGMAARQARNEDLGGVMTAEQVAMAVAFTRSVKELGVVSSAIWRELGQIIAPFMTLFNNLIIDVLIRVRQWITENQNLLTGALILGGVLMALGTIITYEAMRCYIAAGAIKVLIFLVGVASSLFSAFGAVIGAVGFVLSGAFVPAAIAAGVALLKVVLLLAAAAMAFAWVAVIAGLVAIAVRMLWLRGIIQEAWAFVVGVAIAAWEMLVDEIAVGVNFIAGIFSSLFSGPGGALTAWFGQLWATASEVTGMIGDAFARTWGRAVELLGPLWQAAVTTFGAIRNAIAGNDMQLAWEIVVTFFQLTWARLVAFLHASWIDWKFTVLNAIDEITDFLYDTFSTVWTEIRVLAIQAWEAIKAIVYPIIARMLQTTGIALAAVPGQESRSAALIAASGGLTVVPRTADAVRADVLAGAAAEAAQFNAERNALIGRMQADLADEMAAADGPNRARVAQLDARLAELAAQAQAAADAAANPNIAPGGPGFANRGQTSAGAFSAALLAGFIGAETSSGETAAEREARLARINLDEIVAELRARPGVVMG